MSTKIDVAKVLIQNKEGKFLAVQKSDEYYWKAGKWELPGGKIKRDEKRLEAAKREIKAETDLNVENLIDIVRTEIEEPHSEKPVVDCWISLIEDFSGKIQLSEEHQEFTWASADEFMGIDWHRDAGYVIPVIKHLEEYLDKEKI